jgi:hypothetical protein
MDDLFRRAAENYPLRTDSADFNRVLAGMQKAEAASIADDKLKKNSTGKLLWLLLLIPFIWICNGNYFVQQKESKQPVSVYSKTDLKSAAFEQNKLSTPLSTSIERNQTNISAATQTDRKSFAAAYPRIQVQEYLTDEQKIEKDKKITVLNNSNFNNNDVEAKKEIKQQNQMESEAILAVTTKKDSASVLNEKQEIAKDSVNPQSVVSLKKLNKLQNKTKKFYAGVMAGPDASFVKMQSVSKIGINAGIVVGFQLNKKLSIETGALFTKKYYYSDGKYFNRNKLTIPANIIIENVDGDCNMIEWPIMLRYTFKTTTKHRLSAAAGLSSYFMKNESYDYMYNNAGSFYSRYKTYNQPSNFWFAAVNVGVGYTKNFGKFGSLHIEPYIKIPVQGLGIGSLPITSSGLLIGWTKKLF